jgi:hypothetical protein
MTRNRVDRATSAPHRRWIAGALTAGLAVGVSAPALAQDPTEDVPPEGEAEIRLPDPEPEPTPEPTPVPEAPAAESGYNKGFFIKHDTDKGSYELKVQSRIQTYWQFDTEDTDPDRTNKSDFEVRRARLTLEGHAHTEKLGYKLQIDFGKGFVTLKDYYVDIQAGDELWIRTGQWKRPFSRQQINSSGRLELVDRAITDKAFLTGRDIGVALHNNYEKSPDLEWAFGVFNGQGDAPKFSGDADPMTGEVSGGFSNVPARLKPVFVGRVGLNRGGIKGYSEADLEGGPLRWAAAASVWAEGDFDDDDATRQQAEVDALVKVEGLSVSGTVFFGLDKAGDVDGQLLGAHLQVGKMFGEYQPVALYAMVKFLGDLEDDADQHEVTVGFGWYPFKHDGKLQVDVGPRISEGGGVADHLVGRVQMSVGF